MNEVLISAGIILALVIAFSSAAAKSLRNRARSCLLLECTDMVRSPTQLRIRGLAPPPVLHRQRR